MQRRGRGRNKGWHVPWCVHNEHGLVRGDGCHLCVFSQSKQDRTLQDPHLAPHAQDTGIKGASKGVFGTGWATEKKIEPVSRTHSLERVEVGNGQDVERKQVSNSGQDTESGRVYSEHDWLLVNFRTQQQHVTNGTTCSFRFSSFPLSLPDTCTCHAAHAYLPTKTPSPPFSFACECPSVTFFSNLSRPTLSVCTQV